MGRGKSVFVFLNYQTKCVSVSSIHIHSIACVCVFLPQAASEAAAPWLRLLLALEAGDTEDEDEDELVCTETGVEEGEASRSPDSISVKGNQIRVVGNSAHTHTHMLPLFLLHLTYPKQYTYLKPVTSHSMQHTHSPTHTHTQHFFPPRLHVNDRFGQKPWHSLFSLSV